MRCRIVLFLTLIATSCGKVGDPKPPIHRAPLAANGVSTGQNGYLVTLSWTNPARYVDNVNSITDLAYVRILKNGVQIAREKAEPAGQPQSTTVDVSDDLDKELKFSVQVETTRGQLSPVSEVATIRPKEIPGSPRSVRSRVDDDRITLDWLPPERKPELAEVYLVQRSDRQGVVPAMTNHYEDDDYEPLGKYDYTITAARAGNPAVPGASITVPVVARDETPPAAPTGLSVLPAPMGVFLNWDANKERDFKEYLIYRSDQAEPIFPPTSVNAAPDPGYRSGLSYQLVAVDKSGNRSDKSAPTSGP